MLNQKVSQIFHDMAVLLELLGENPFKVRAYERAAMHIESMPESLEDYLLQGRLRQIPGIGKDLSEKIEQIYKTGTCAQYEELKSKLPSGLIDMLNVQGLGPKKIRILYDKLHIDSLDKLEKAAREGRLQTLAGFGVKTEENILKAIRFLRSSADRIPLGKALPIALDIKNFVTEIDSVRRVDIAGSIRRFKETVHDIDMLVISDKPGEVMDGFISYRDVDRVIACGGKKSSVVVAGLQVDLRVFDEENYGAALMYFTGSKQHNIRLRQLCLEKGWKLNEYGLYKANRRLAGKSEEEIYHRLSMDWIPPELREDQGEVELSLEHRLPSLVESTDIKGDLHMHSTYSDGASSIEELVIKAISLGYSYIAITDHSFTLSVANAMTRDKFFSIYEEVKRLREKYRGFEILVGMEVDIFGDGELDCHKDILDMLDVVVIAIHSRFQMSKKQMTKRIVKAMSHPRANVLAHPTGRLLGVRDSYEVDIEELLNAARNYQVALELNASPLRLDITSDVCRRAKELGAKVCINTDSHSIDQMDNMYLGVGTARRGWLEKDDVLNTMDIASLKRFLAKNG